MESSAQLQIEDTSSGELLAVLDRTGKVNLESGADTPGPGGTVQLRKRGDTYYCDTSIKLLSFDSREEFLACLDRLGIGDSAASATA